jgi:hypothetical protein
MANTNGLTGWMPRSHAIPQRTDRWRTMRAAALTGALTALAGCGPLMGDNPSVSSLAVLNDCPYTVKVSVAPEKTSGPGAYHAEDIEPGSQQGWASSLEQGEFVVIVTGPLKGEWRTTVPYSVEAAHPGVTILGAACPE